ncbi:MAG: hypothetical protein EP345_03815 [Sphingomonadales bacterium]|jgi:hypothetical protein|nr:MAG: hypothetical protein EP345_03815 [Sphingomonadales bacterium]
MANNYLKLSFTISPAPQEVELLDECYDLSTELADLDEKEQGARYDSMSDAFKAAFPKKPRETVSPHNIGRGEIGPEHAVEEEGDPFASFRDMFSDGDFPTFDVEHFGFTSSVDNYLIAGSQADPYAIASVIQKCAPSVLPLAFEWAQTCDRLRPGEFGGGYYVVTSDDIIGGGTNWLMHGELNGLKGESNPNTILPDTDVVFDSKPGEHVWITVGEASIRVKHEDEGVVVDVYAVSHEDIEASASLSAPFAELERREDC